jgi:hypothetical protein
MIGGADIERGTVTRDGCTTGFPFFPLLFQQFFSVQYLFLGRFLRICLFLGLPDSLVRDTNHGSGSFYHQVKIVKKTLIPTVLWLLYDFLSLKNYVKVPSIINKQKNLDKMNDFLLASWRSMTKKQNPDQLVRGPDPCQFYVSCSTLFEETILLLYIFS